MMVDCQPYAPAAFTPRKYSWYSFLLENEPTPEPYCDRKDFMSMKNPLTVAGIEPATFRFVAQHLNYCATAVSSVQTYMLIFLKSHQGMAAEFSTGNSRSFIRRIEKLRKLRDIVYCHHLNLRGREKC
jgi:hypothetical protein